MGQKNQLPHPLILRGLRLVLSQEFKDNVASQGAIVEVLEKWSCGFKINVFTIWILTTPVPNCRHIPELFFIVDMRKRDVFFSLHIYPLNNNPQPSASYAPLTQSDSCMMPAWSG